MSSLFGSHRLAEKLPQVNVTLLHYLFGVLHCIEQRSDTNQMTAFNLAVCIAPSLLWLPNPSSPEAEGEFTRKVSVLVQFLIENYCMIFVDDISLLYASLSAKDDNREDSSDLCSFKHIDSSYDSLENELNDDGDSSYSGPPTMMGHDNRSRDSVLTLSDCDLDHASAEEAENFGSSQTQCVKMSAGCHHRSASHEHSENESLCSNTSGYSSTTDVRRHRRCSEPAIGILASRFSQLNESSHENNSSCDALLSQSADDYLKQHRYLQVEGQKLINRSLTLGIEVTKNNTLQTNDKKTTPIRLLPPSALRLNICPHTSCSSLSSPATSPSGSSLSSLDSAFSQFSDYSVLTPNDVPSPLDCTLRQHRKQGELSPDFLGVNSFSGFAGAEQVKQPYNGSVFSTGKNTVDWQSHKSPVSTQPMAWLKNSRSTVKNWTSKKTDKATNEDKSKTDEDNTTKGLSSNKPENSECSLLMEHIPVPKIDCQTNHRITVPRPTEINEDAPLGCNLRFGEEVTGRLVSTRTHSVDKGVPDRNGNDANGVEYSSFLFPSPVSINIEISPHSQDGAQMPQTLFLGHNIALFSQRNRRKSTNSYILEDPVPLSANLKSSSEHTVHPHGDQTPGTKDDSNKTSISIRVASFKKNRVLPSNVDTGVKIANCDLEKNFCVSPKLSTSVGDLFLQTEIHNKHIKSTQESDNPIIKGGRDWHTERCSDPKFEEVDQRFFAEESYV